MCDCILARVHVCVIVYVIVCVLVYLCPFVGMKCMLRALDLGTRRNMSLGSLEFAGYERGPDE